MCRFVCRGPTIATSWHLSSGTSIIFSTSPHSQPGRRQSSEALNNSGLMISDKRDHLEVTRRAGPGAASDVMVRRQATLDPLRASGVARLRDGYIAVWRTRNESTDFLVGTCQTTLKIVPAHRRAGAGSLVSRCRRKPPGSHGGPCALVAMISLSW